MEDKTVKKILFLILLLPLLIQKQAAGQDVLEGVYIPDHNLKTVCYSADQILEKAVTTDRLGAYVSGKIYSFLLVVMNKEGQPGFYIKKGDQFCLISSDYQKAGDFFPYTIRQDAKSPNSVELVYREEAKIVYREGRGFEALQPEYIEIYDLSHGVVSITIKD